MSVLDLAPVLAAKSAALLLLTVAAALGFRRSSAATRHLIWTGGLLASLALPIASLAGPRLPIVPGGLWPQAAAVFGVAGSPVVAVDVATDVAVAGPPLAEGPAVTVDVVADVAVVEPPMVETPAAVSPAAARPATAGMPAVLHAGVPAAAAATPAFAGPDAAPLDWPVLLALGWLAGVCVALLRLLAGRIAIHRIARRAVPVVSPEWLDSIETALCQQDPDRPVRFLESAEAWTPCTWGTVRPTILLPTVGVDWSNEARRQVIVHELAHVRRYDCLTQLLGQLACALQWFNPLAWLAARSARMAREQACDDAVLAAGSLPSDYAGLLLEAAAPEGSGPWVPAEALAMARRSQLGDRLLAVLDPARPREPVSRRRVAWTAVAALGLLLPVAAASPQEPRPPKPPRAAAAGRPSRAPIPPRPATPPRAPSPLGAAPMPAAPDAMEPLAPLPATAPTPGEPPSPPSPASLTGAEAPGAPAPGLPSALRPPVAPAPTEASALEPLATRAIPAPPRPPLAAADVPGDCRTDDRGRNRTVRLNSSVQITGTGNLSDGRGNVSVVWTGPDCSVIIRLRGQPTFTEAEDDVASLSSNGRFEIADEDGSSDRSYVVTMRDGRLERRYRVDGRDAELDAEARAWRQDMILAFLRRSGFDAKARAERIRRTKGFDGLMAEIEAIPSDGGKTRYLTVALDQADLTEAQVVRILGLSQSVDSDGDRSSVLARVPVRHLARVPVQRAYLAAVQGIDSDGDVAAVLIRLLETGSVDGSTCGYLLGLVREIGSDGDRSQVLVRSIPVFRNNLECQNRAIALTADIGSDGDKAGVLIEYVRQLGLESGVRNAFFRAAATIGSNGDHSAVLHRVIASRPSETTVLALLENARGIGSNGDLAGVLVDAANTGLVRSAAARSAYLTTARGIGSDGDRQAALNAVGSTER